MKALADAYDFGRYLQELRRASEIPLEAVSQVTKIRLVVLQQIENEDLKALPTPTITKGFLRAFADAVGADQTEVLNRYDAALALQFPHTEEPSSQGEPRPGWVHLLLAILLIAALIALSLYLVKLPERSTATPPVEMPKATQTPRSTVPEGKAEIPVSAPQAPEANSVGEEQATMESPPPQTEPGDDEKANPEEDAVTVSPESEVGNQDAGQQSTPAPATDNLAPASAAMETAHPQTGEKLMLHVTAVDLTWLQIIADDGEPREMMLQPGRQITLEAQERFQLIIGNAAGVHIQLNGRPVNIPDQSGKVIHLQLP